METVELLGLKCGKIECLCMLLHGLKINEQFIGHNMGR